jgi:hypothetical protein
MVPDGLTQSTRVALKMWFSPDRLAAVAFGFAVFMSTQSLADSGAAPDPGGSPQSAAPLAELYKGMSTSARDALERILKTRGIDALSKISESGPRQTFGGMAPSVRDEIQAKWDSLTDEQRAVLKKLKPDDIKDMAAAQAKEIVQASVAPIVKPVMDSTKEVASETASVMKKSRDYVRRLIAELTGATRSEAQPPEGANSPGKN